MTSALLSVARIAAVVVGVGYGTVRLASLKKKKAAEDAKHGGHGETVAAGHH